MPHLWDPKHPYYCCGNDMSRHASWTAFFAAMGGADIDMNLVFRWDISGATDDDDKPVPDWTRATLTLHIMHQRKGRYATHEVSITRDDEPAVILYLTKHWETMRAIWAPFTAASGPAVDEVRAQMRARRIALLEAELSELRKVLE